MESEDELPPDLLELDDEEDEDEDDEDDDDSLNRNTKKLYILYEIKRYINYKTSILNTLLQFRAYLRKKDNWN